MLSGAPAAGVGRDARLGMLKMVPRGKKKQRDPFLMKEWYATNAPSILGVRSRGKTLASRTQDTKIALEELKGQVLKLDLADFTLDSEMDALVRGPPGARSGSPRPPEGMPEAPRLARES